MTQPPEVVLSDVTKRFGATLAVDDVSLSIRRGEFFSLLGPSGCGKTTTLRMVAGFERPTDGTIEIRNQVVNDVPAHRRQTNLVFQQLALFPHLDTFDNVAFGLRLKRMPKSEIRKRVLDILRVVGLEGLHDRRVSQISGGQQQRVAIARALVNEPAVLLLDEPLGSLDLKLRTQMQRELKSLQNRVGTTFVYVTHDQGEALAMSDRIAVMSDGRIEQVGSGHDIYVRPESAFVAAFIGETNLLEGHTRGSDGDLAVVEVHGRPLRAQRTAPLRTGQQVTVSLRPEMVHLQPVDAPRREGRDAWRLSIADVVFLGSTIRYELELGAGTTIRVSRPADEAILRPGDEVLVSWDPTSPVAISQGPAPTTGSAQLDPAGQIS